MILLENGKTGKTFSVINVLRDKYKTFGEQIPEKIYIFEVL